MKPACCKVDIGVNPHEKNAFGQLTEGAWLLRQDFGHYLQSQSVVLAYMFTIAPQSAGKKG